MLLAASQTNLLYPKVPPAAWRKGGHGRKELEQPLRLPFTLPSHMNACLAAKGKSVKWKLGADSEVWVWVMGEHMLDKPYDMICDQILAQRAQQQPKEEVR